MTASARRSAPDVTAPVRRRTRAAARLALVALFAALGHATMQPAVAAVPTGAGPYSIFGGTTPAVGSWPDDDGVELGVRFRTDVDGWITGVRFYKGPGNGGTHTGSLWTAAGELLASEDFSEETAEGWQEQTFDDAVRVHSGTTYVASYFAPRGYYAADRYYFTDAAAGEGPVRALASGVDGPNGVFQYGSQPSFPAMSSDDQNYWVDVVFLTAIPADDEPAEPTHPVDPTDPVPSRVPTDPVSSPVTSDPVPSRGPSDPAPSPDPTVSSDPVPSPDEAAPTDPVSSPAPTDPVSSPIPTDPVSSPDPTDPVSSPIPTGPVASPIPTVPTDPAPADPARQAVVAAPTPAVTAPAPGPDGTETAADPDTRTQLAEDQHETTAAVRVAVLAAPVLAAAAGVGIWHVRRVRGRRL
jgi:hypothetical protein